MTTKREFVRVIDEGELILAIDYEDNVTFGKGLTPEEAIVRAMKVIYKDKRDPL